MFDPSVTPRLFGLPPGVDFPVALIDGLRTRLADQPPESIARVEIIVNTTRMRRRLRALFNAGPPTLLPRIRLLTDLADPVTSGTLPDPVSSLRRRLELTKLIAVLLEKQPDLAPRSALYDLADSLAGLMDEMQIEGVPPSVIEALDVSDQSGHWQRALDFLRIVQRYFDDGQDQADTIALQRLALEQRLKRWEIAPPQHPILLAGSTGSRGTTLRLMQAVARLPQGAVVLPGVDFDTPPQVWAELDNPLTGEDHPQFRFARLLQTLDLPPDAIARWTDAQPPNLARNRLLSLALRPAPVTDQWRAEGPLLPMLDTATADITMVAAPTRRDEALAIALRLRQAAEDGETAALITPDRMLTRQVTAALDRWDILPDDSAGTPPQLTPPGRFLRHVAALFQRDLTAEALITLLKHPLTHVGDGRANHLLLTRRLELRIRREGWPYPTAQQITDWGAKSDADDWAAWILRCFMPLHEPADLPLSDWLAQHIDRAESIAAGSLSTDASELWNQPAGREVRKLVDDLQREAPFGGALNARDYGDLFARVLAGGEVRDRDAPHPGILIWGTLEARVMGADLLILGGLNEGSWPELPGADPWLNRKMRADAGLLLPERRIGLSAHDFQQAACAPQVWLTRAAKSDDAETVPSRWLNRLMNLMKGLPERGGPDAIKAMTARGDHWLALTRALEAPIPADPAPRPSPAPPVLSRPMKLSVTEIKRLIRDPYVIYARHVLRLRPLNPLQRAPDALLRGIVLHDVMDKFLREVCADPDRLRADVLSDLSAGVIRDQIPFPAIRHLWQARINRIAGWFVETEGARQKIALPHPSRLEINGTATLITPTFTLTAKADRIDIDANGNAHIYDYKTGAAPSKAEQRHFDKQLLLEAAMVENGAFDGIGPRKTVAATFLSLAANPAAVAAPLDEVPPEQAWQEFQALILAYSALEQGYTARRAMLSENNVSDYDHLARYGEWDTSQPAVRVELT